MTAAQGARASRPASTLTQLTIFSERVLIGWRQDAASTITTIVAPALMLLMYTVVLGDSVTKANKLFGDGHSSIYDYVALVAVTGAMSASSAFAVALLEDSSLGLTSRFWTMPVGRSADLIGRLFGEAMRAVLITLFIVGIGAVLGFRFHHGPATVVGFFAIVVLIELAFAVATGALTLMLGHYRGVEYAALLTTILSFFNTGFVPLFAYPAWLQPIVANQPLSCAIDAMRAFSYGGDVTTPALKTIAWSCGLIAIFAYPAIVGYRRAALAGGRGD